MRLNSKPGLIGPSLSCTISHGETRRRRLCCRRGGGQIGVPRPQRRQAGYSSEGTPRAAGRGVGPGGEGLLARRRQSFGVARSSSRTSTRMQGLGGACRPWWLSWCTSTFVAATSGNSSGFWWTAAASKMGSGGGLRRLGGPYSPRAALLGPSRPSSVGGSSFSIFVSRGQSSFRRGRWEGGKGVSLQGKARVGGRRGGILGLKGRVFPPSLDLS